MKYIPLLLVIAIYFGCIGGLISMDKMTRASRDPSPEVIDAYRRVSRVAEKAQALIEAEEKDQVQLQFKIHKL